MTGAAVHRIVAQPLMVPGRMLLVNEYAGLECGCRVYVGLRVDNQEAAAASTCCSDEHSQLMEHFTLLLKESLVEPLAVPLVDVCARLLDEARRHVD